MMCMRLRAQTERTLTVFLRFQARFVVRTGGRDEERILQQII
jgi:hypothetical protein